MTELNITQKKKLFYATKINSIIGIIFDNLDTNIKPEEIINLLPDVLKADLGNIEFMTLPVHDAEDHIHLIPEKDAIKEIIESNFKGVK